MILDTGNVCSNLMRTQGLWTYMTVDSYIRSSSLEWENEKIDKIRNWEHKNNFERKDKISSDKNHNERVHMGTNVFCPSKTEIVTQWTV